MILSGCCFDYRVEYEFYFYAVSAKTFYVDALFYNLLTHGAHKP